MAFVYLGFVFVMTDLYQRNKPSESSVVNEPGETPATVMSLYWLLATLFLLWKEGQGVTYNGVFALPCMARFAVFYFAMLCFATPRSSLLCDTLSCAALLCFALIC